MNTRIRWNKTKTVGLVQNLEDTGPPWFGSIRHHDLLDCYIATSALYERPQDLGLFAGADEAQRAVERDAMNLAARRAHAAQVAMERRLARAAA